MKIKVGTVKREEFVSKYVIQFPNGLRLYTQDLLWDNIENKEKIKNQFQEIVEIISEI